MKTPLTQSQLAVLTAIHEKSDTMPVRGGGLARVLTALKDKKLINAKGEKLTKAGETALGVPPKPRKSKRELPEGAEAVLYGEEVAGFIVKDQQFSGIINIWKFQGDRPVKIGNGSSRPIARTKIIKAYQENFQTANTR